MVPGSGTALTIAVKVESPISDKEKSPRVVGNIRLGLKTDAPDMGPMAVSRV